MASTRGSHQTVRLTKKLVDALPPPAQGQAFHRDADLPGFALRVTASGVKAFVVEKRVAGQVRRMTVGRYGELTVEQAREAARRLISHIVLGGNPRAEREREQKSALTLEQVFAAFQRVRPLKARTLYEYQRLLEVAFADWKTRALATISKDMVAQRHLQLGTQRGQAYANLAMRVLRSVFNFALAHYEDGTGRAIFEHNPVVRLTRTRSWFPTRRRSSVIKGHQLHAWAAAVSALRKEGAVVGLTVADYLEFLLYSGLRRQEAAQLRWDQIDLEDRALIIPDPKNKVPHTLPLSCPLIAILERRQAARTNAFVFPGRGPTGYLVEPKRQIEKVIAASSLHFTLHDLRRTFITAAEALDVPPYAIKRLVNHKMANDVTAGYIVSDLERLRAPMERVATFLEAALRGEVPGATVHHLPRRSA